MKNSVAKFLSTTFFAFSLFLYISPLAAFFTPQDTGPLMTEIGSHVTWTIEEGESVSSIATAYYGDPDYWTTIWNDNPWIENPWLVEEGWVLELRNHVPNKPQTLETDLMQRLSQTTYFYYPEVQYHPALGTVAITETVSSNPEVQGITAEFIQPSAVPTQQPVQPTPAPITYSGGPLTEAQITYLGQCEAGMDPTKNTGNGYYGAFQFSYGTWKSMNTGYERADLAPLEVQKDAVQRLLSRSSIFTQFPGCARKMQANGLL